MPWGCGLSGIMIETSLLLKEIAQRCGHCERRPFRPELPDGDGADTAEFPGALPNKRINLH